MKKVSLPLLKVLLLLSFLIMFGLKLFSQSCTPQGDQTSYGTNNTWIGYAYQGLTFNTYNGYITEGNSSSPDFDESFGGDQVNYATNGCAVYTDQFSMRYKLAKNFSNGDYIFTVGGDDGFRLSLDGGVTWVIDAWNLQSYTTRTYTVHLNGNYNLVLEYYENSGQNRLSFVVAPACVGNGNPASYGTGGWNGYHYQGTNFNVYKGVVVKGTEADINFDESFGGSNTTYTTSNCSIQTEQFSVRYRLQRVFAPGTYIFTIGGDDGYRFSIDGGVTWVINNWTDHPYNITTQSISMNGTYNLVLEYYESGGGNRVSFSMSSSLLPIKLNSWSGIISGDKASLQWKAEGAENFSHFTVQRSNNGINFQDIKRIDEATGITAAQSYFYKDLTSLTGTTYYRLAMADKDGSIVYSTIISLTPQNFTATKMYPTILQNGMLFIETDRSSRNVKLDIHTMNGTKIMQQYLGGGSRRHQVNTGTQTSGSYVAILSDGSDIISKKIIFIQ
ncbi:MAG: hypothetical protein H7122_07910 [Chitinophagaceae bacterium]|nr:hypothetical protein [Chitinophagaceae bacterium]